MRRAELDPRCVRILNVVLPGIAADFMPWHERFVEALGRIADESEQPEA